MDKDDQIALETAVDVLNTVGREAAEYLVALLEKEDNEEAAEWLEIKL